MTLHRNPTIFFTPFALAAAAAEAAIMVNEGSSYSPSWMLPYLLTSMILLAVAVAIVLVFQLANMKFNRTPLLPALVLLFSDCVVLAALRQPGVLGLEHWDTAFVTSLHSVMSIGIPILGLASLAIAGANLVNRKPISIHAYGHGRLYRASPEAVAHITGAGRNQAQVPSGGTAEPAKPYRAKAPRLDFSKLYGNQDLKDRLLEAGQEWRERGKNGVLLSGPPGTGKTAFGEALAGELGLQFIYVTFGDMASKWVNETTERLVAIFNAATEQQPVMLFIDEIDAVLKDRRSLGAGSSEEYERIVATFLGRATALQGSQVLLVAATNYLERLDEAAIREGRFDFKITVPLPDAPARRHLVESRLLAHGCTSDNETLERLTRRWGGFNVPRILAAADAACEIARVDAGLPATFVAPSTSPTLSTESDPVVDDETVQVTPQLQFSHFYRALRKIQGRKGGAPEGAKALSDLFLDADQASRLAEIGAQLSRIDEIEHLGGSVPKGLLFSGPPGTGKTATAMALAKECGWSFIERNGRDLMREGEIDRLRSEASDLRPAIVFLDEADDVLADRSYSNIKSVTNELLTLIDGAGGMLQDVVWIAATNHPESIDSAALRGGRFEQKIAFGPLGDEAMLRMILQWAQANQEHLSEDVGTWAAKAFEHVQGQTPANVQSILRLANNMAVAKHVSAGTPREVTVRHVRQAADEIGRG